MLSAEQKRAIEKIHQGIKEGKPKQTLGGYAGTGKSHVIRHLKQLYPNFAVCAFTGKATSNLRRRGIKDAQTIHSAIYRPKTDEDGETHFDLKEPHEIKCDGFYIDESSMVAREEHDNLLSFNKPIVFVGDHGQLEPVGENINLMENPDYTLEEIHRNAGEIAHFAEWLRKGNVARHFKTEGKVQIATYRQVRDEHLTATDQIICAYNKFRVSINRRVRKALGYSQLLEEGEKVICLRNHRGYGVYNGQQGTAHEVNLKFPDWPTFKFKSYDGSMMPLVCDGKQFHTEKGQVNDNISICLFDYAPCVTAHKSQGDEWDNTVVFEQVCDRWDHKRWAYTAASRSKNGVIWVEDPKALQAPPPPENDDDFIF